MKAKKESEKTDLKLNIKKTKTMVTSPITSCQNRRGKSGNSNRLFFPLGSKITVDGDCRHEIKRSLLLGRKAMTNLDSVLKKQRHHFADKGPYKAIDFLVIMYRCEKLDHKEG